MEPTNTIKRPKPKASLGVKVKSDTSALHMRKKPKTEEYSQEEYVVTLYKV